MTYFCKLACVACCRAQSLSDSLSSHGWPSTHISATLEQGDRLLALSDLKHYKCRVLVSTDLVSYRARGHRPRELPCSWPQTS